MSENERDEAIRSLQRQMLQLTADMNRVAGDTQEVLFKDFASEYLAEKLNRTKLRDATKRSFENQVLKHLIPRFGQLPLGKINNAIWNQWIADEKKITKFFNARKSIIEILSAAVELNLIQKVPQLDNPDEYEPVGRVLLLKEILGILWRAARPFRLIFYAFWKMGCRPREILQWEWTMIEWSRTGRDFSYIHIPARISKTGRSRVIALDPDLAGFLRQRFRLYGHKSIFVFPKRNDPTKPQWSYQSAWVTACRKAKVLAAMVYDFRRTFVTVAIDAGKQIDRLARHLDTSAPMIRRFYLKEDVNAMEGLFT